MKFIIKIRFVVLHDSHVPVPTQTSVMRADWAYHGKGVGSAVGLACGPQNIIFASFHWV